MRQNAPLGLGLKILPTGLGFKARQNAPFYTTQSGGFLGKLLSKLAGPLMKVAMPLSKNVLAPLGLTAAMSAIDGSIQKKIHGSGIKLIIEEEDMKDIMKIIEALENSGILLKGISKTIENETKNKEEDF